MEDHLLFQADCDAVVTEKAVSAVLDLPVWSDAMLACICMSRVWSNFLTRQAKLVLQALLPQAHAAQNEIPTSS